MSVIQNIRNKYAGVTIALIVLALIGFILMDAFSNRSSSIFGSDNSIAKVNGEKLDYMDYSRRVQNYEVLYGSSQQGLTDDMRAQLQQQALKDMIKETLILDECEQLGLETTEAEKKDMIYGMDPDPAVKQYQPFLNRETNQFDPQYVRAFEEQVDQLDPSGKARAHWETMKDYILRNNLPNKYSALFTGGAYMPRFMIEFKKKNDMKKADLDFVKVGYETMDDNNIQVTDADIKEYMKKHSGEYSVEEASRTIEYVAFTVVPSSEDTMAALGTLQDIKADFETAKDAESFVNRNSDDTYEGKYVMKKGYMSLYSDSIFSLPVDGVFGPYFENGTYKLVRVTDKKIYPDSVKCRHILVKTEDRRNPIMSDSLAKLRLDSAIQELKSGVDFNTVVQKYSDDEGSKGTAGEYTFTFDQKPNLSKEFADFIFDGKEGQKETVKVENGAYSGYHYIEIMDQGEKHEARQLAFVSKGLFAGDVTENHIYGLASAFASENVTAEKFDEAVKEQKLGKRVADNILPTSFTIPGVGSSRELIRWTYNAELGDVSQVFPVANNYVVAKLSEVQDKGIMNLTDDVKITIEDVIRREKKAQAIKDKYKSANNLSAIASQGQNFNAEIMTADSVSGGSPFIGPIGYEPKVAGYIFSGELKPNVVTPVRGEGGVLFLSLKKMYSVSAAIDTAAVTRERNMEESQIKNSIGQSVQEDMVKRASVKYNTNNF
ncbi:MAG: SurA N-terminal domain-containing protein [Chitinophagales bacterium]|nr:SurA N-terminal domain-containing protein [Chitinophagaceae bacterium]MCB9064155.1 SurA N-terminal domain-containing protein [Chitinophagales bacterium]